MSFKNGERAVIKDETGEDIDVVVMSGIENGFCWVGRINSDGRQVGGPDRVQTSKLFRPRGPFFGLNGEVLTTSLAHRNETGVIVATGKTQTGVQVFAVEFKNGEIEWFNGDHIILKDVDR